MTPEELDALDEDSQEFQAETSELPHTARADAFAEGEASWFSDTFFTDDRLRRQSGQGT